MGSGVLGVVVVELEVVSEMVVVVELVEVVVVGRRTLSIVWMTPLLASMSVAVMVAVLLHVQPVHLLLSSSAPSVP